MKYAANSISLYIPIPCATPFHTISHETIPQETSLKHVEILSASHPKNSPTDLHEAHAGIYTIHSRVYNFSSKRDLQPSRMSPVKYPFYFRRAAHEPSFSAWEAATAARFPLREAQRIRESNALSARDRNFYSRAGARAFLLRAPSVCVRTQCNFALVFLFWSLCYGSMEEREKERWEKNFSPRAVQFMNY